jgi:hypothetical protein
MFGEEQNTQKDSKWFRFCEMEKQAIATMKWLESEKSSKDVGENHARWLWLTTEREKWIKSLAPEDRF